jgi:hypothetical protein
MPNAQQDYPLTLAEVLFEELEATDGVMPPIPGNQWREIEEGIKEIRAVATGSPDSIAASNVDPFDLIWKRRTELSSRLVPKIYQLIHKLPEARSALCLSGGGIRSATFNLGLLQGLARNGQLGEFNYLSTVSGGGFIGSWLTAWIYRAGTNAISELGRPRPVSAKGEPTPLQPEPKPVDNLRVYSNYLTPKKGLLSADTWTLIAVYLRNLLLNWLVFLPAIMTALMLPRIWAALVSDVETARHPSLYLVVGILGVVAGGVSLVGIMRNLPSIGNKNWRTGTILAVVVVPLCLMAMLLCIYWLGIKQEPSLANLQISSRFWEPFLKDIGAVWQGNRPGWPSFVLIGALIPGGPLLVLSLKQRNAGVAARVVSVLLVIAAGAVTGILTYVGVHAELVRRLAVLCGVRYDQMFACLAVPAIMIVLLIGGTLVAGFSSRFSKAEDQEWWARCGGWSLIIIIVWLVVSPLVMFGPMFLVDLRGLFSGKNFGTTKSIIATVVGIVSGAITLFGGFSSKTPANKEVESSDFKAKILGLATSAAAAIFALFIIILLVWLTDWLLFGLARALRVPLPPAGKFLEALRLLPVWLQVVTAGALFVLAAVTGYLINTNRFSLHYYWRNRIVRAYLGASNPARDDSRDETRVANNFTEFAESDSIRMSEIASSGVKKLYHVINIALNLAGGEKLEWQDRKCESFTISPLHCGSYWLGYRRSKDYGRGTQRNIKPDAKTGISLGTAVAISGAAASPNMGYMMTSPIARFLMTLFNVRLGFWLGNPGLKGGGDKPTFQRDSPTQSVRPIVAEALGMTNARSPYVYLSDGGHFENLGLYEMALRRCRLIVVSDASTDPAYAFESLAMAIRQIRVDFGVPIDMQKMSFGNAPDPDHNYCAIGKIRYSCVDKPSDAEEDSAYDGYLVYIKPSLIDDEPRDVLNYHQANPSFPEETIVDQWFSESQFESYRMLGSHMIEKICEERGMTATGPLDKFRKQAEAHITRKPRR